MTCIREVVARFSSSVFALRSVVVQTDTISSLRRSFVTRRFLVSEGRHDD
jgi:hypothetical protein